MLAPSEALGHLKCNICNNYLSYFPIYLDRNTNGQLCGRCSEVLPPSESTFRNATYESVAQFLKFPCIFAFEGCVEHLTPDHVPDHEASCSYRTVSCPMECTWQGTVNDLRNHVEEIHPGDILRNGEFPVETVHSYEIYNFFIHQEELFSIKRKYNSTEKILELSAFCYKILDNFTKYFYEITVFNAARNLSVKNSLKSAENFQDENCTKIKVENIMKILNDPAAIIGCLKMYTQNEEDSSVSKKTYNPEINEEMLSELECPVCMEYLVPPIYQCMTGHSICGDCKEKVADCPTCHTDIKTKNFVVEKMTSLINYPCKYADKGCKFVSKPASIKQHQKFCPLGPHPCPLSNYEACKWNGAAKDTYNHLLRNHHDNLLEIDVIYVFLNNGYFRGEESQCYIKQFGDVMFQLHYKYSQNCFYWAMQFIGPDDQAKNYKFEIDIFDNTNSNQKFFLRSFCTSLKSKQETFVQPGEYVFVSLDQIRSFLTDQLNYTVRVTK